MLAAGNGHFTVGHGEHWGGAGTAEARPCAARPAGKSAGMHWDSLTQAAPSPWEWAPHTKPQRWAFMLWAFIIRVERG